MNDTYLQIDNLPNRLTLFRIALIPVVVCLLLIAHPDFNYFVFNKNCASFIAALIFIIASITDFLDGYIARKRNIVTVFGSFLDPIADKFLIVSSLIMLIHLNRVHTIFVLILILREFYITSLRLLALNEGFHVPVQSLGKLKTIFQMIAIPLLMIYQKIFFIDLGFIGTIFISLSCLLSIYSAFEYSTQLIKKFKLKKINLKRKKWKNNSSL